ncbi:hypothetical protein [Bacillus sp. 1P06AnD]|uniref:hypothetical protein n=1 Tax=Bacillus sp. 1P06AnD TaxID=3132208 RepID=UPI00399F9F92
MNIKKIGTGFILSAMLITGVVGCSASKEPDQNKGEAVDRSISEYTDAVNIAYGEDLFTEKTSEGENSGVEYRSFVDKEKGYNFNFNSKKDQLTYVQFNFPKEDKDADKVMKVLLKEIGYNISDENLGKLKKDLLMTYDYSWEEALKGKKPKNKMKIKRKAILDEEYILQYAKYEGNAGKHTYVFSIIDKSNFVNTKEK